MHQRTAYTSVPDVLDEMVRLANQYKSEPIVRDATQHVTSDVDISDRRAVATSVWRWIRENIRYVRDPTNTELLQSPDRILSPPRYADCDGMSMLAAAMLSSVHISTGFRAIAQAEAGAYDHVYAIYEPKPDAQSWHALDATAPLPPGPDTQAEQAESTKTVFLSDNQRPTDMSGRNASLTVVGSNDLAQSDGQATTTSTDPVYPADGSFPDWMYPEEEAGGGSPSTENGGNTNELIKTGIQEVSEIVGAIWGSQGQQSTPPARQPTTPAIPGGQQQAKILGMSPSTLAIVAVAGGGVVYLASNMSDN